VTGPPLPPRPPHDPFDRDFYEAAVREVAGPIFDTWFRPALFRRDLLPAEGPAIIAANHSGNSFPYDGMVLDALIYEAEGGAARKVRGVYEKELTLTWWMRPFGVDDFWRKGGGVDLTFDNFEILLQRGERLLYFPEGVPGIGKGFHHRYELQRFSTSFVLLGARTRAKVVPLYIINAEWVIPFSYTWKPLDRFMDRHFHVPFLPLPWGVIAVLWPWAWYLALPAKMVFVLGESLDVAEMLLQEGLTDLDQPDRAKLNSVAAKIRRHMQAELDDLVKLHGRKPYRAGEWLRKLRESGRNFFRILPLGWPAAFVRFDRDRKRPAARNALLGWLRDWDVIFWYLPFIGWPLLQLARSWRRPPYGYRGLSPEQRREREGRWTWRLAERPLPPVDGRSGR
jgi:1-acyl-sn-glycerol-3-phosphate acyltransferase